MVLKFGVRSLQKSIDIADLNLRCGLGRGLPSLFYVVAQGACNTHSSRVSVVLLEGWRWMRSQKTVSSTFIQEWWTATARYKLENVHYNLDDETKDNKRNTNEHQAQRVGEALLIMTNSPK